MIIRFESANSPPPRIVKMNANEDGIFLRVLDGDPLLEWNKDVGRPGHYDFEIRFPQLAGKTFRDVKGGGFFRAAKGTVSAIVFAAVSGIDHHGVERFAGVLGRAAFNRPPSGGAGCEQARTNEK